MLRSWGRLVLLVPVLGLLALTACAPSTAPAGSSGPGGSTDRPTVVVAFYPFQFIAQRVAGDTVQIETLTSPGQEPHDLELTAKQVASVADADLVVYEKTFQTAVDEAVSQSGGKNALDTTTVVPLQPAGPGVEEEHDGDHGTDHEHESSGLDPHAWLDPTNMVTITQAVTERLAAISPQNAATYRTNAAALVAQLTDLDTAYRTGLTGCQRTEFITTHAAFGYLAKRYGLEQVGISGLSPDAEPSPARIAEIQQTAKEHQVTTIFYETLVSPAVAQSIASDLKLKTDVLDPLEGITDQSRGTDYLAVMTANLAALRTANGCS